ncbi:uncharacterized protein [Anser cygnoides]|uniref:uncharacterized protein n=1 Tax=Anser cygnoides TaxID=8845 RepID=UPI0034D29D49
MSLSSEGRCLVRSWTGKSPCHGAVREAAGRARGVRNSLAGAKPMEYHGGAGFHAAAGGGDHGGAGGPALMEAVACGRPLPEQIPGRTCRPWRGDHAGAGGMGDAVYSF